MVRGGEIMYIVLGVKVYSPDVYRDGRKNEVS